MATFTLDDQTSFNPLRPQASFQSLDSHTHSPTSNAQTPQSSSQNPPQIFGNYSPDGSLLPPSLPPGSIFGDDGLGFGYEDGQDYADAKRRRIARACDMCRKKKIKCDAKLPKCSHCENYKTECIFTHTEKKRAPPKGAKYIEGLENRLGRMEHLLRLSGLLGEEGEDGSTDLGTLEERLAKQVGSRNASPTHGSDGAVASSPSEASRGDRKKSTPKTSTMATPRSLGASPETQSSLSEQKKEEPPKEAEVNDLADRMWCSLITNSHGETRFVGSSSGFSIFSPKGVQWVNEKTGDSSFQQMIADISTDDNKWFPWREEIFGDIFARRTFKALPPQKECFELISNFFAVFNQLFPLFHEPTFMHLLDKQYSNTPYEGSGWWASLNVVLAICYRIRVVSCLGTTENEDTQAWAYFKNALAVMAELTMKNTDLLSVSALIAMSMFLMGTPNPQPSFYLVSAGIRLAQSIGLHKQTSGTWLNAAEIEQRKRVFWMAYQLDKDICLRSGKPPAQDEDDWLVDLPSENPEDGLGTLTLSDGTKHNIFRSMCRFAIISSKVYNRLYSVKASRQSDGELLNTIGELDAELEEWKDSLPVNLRPDNEIGYLPPPLGLHVVNIHFAYYNCLTTIHRRSVHHGYWSSRLSDYAVQGLNVKPLNPRVFSSAALCVSAARTSIHLIKYLPKGDVAVVWVVIYFPVSALVTLFANILQNPQDARARSDLRLMNAVVTFLAELKTADGTGSMQRMYAVCKNFEQIARVVLEKAEREMTARQKKKQEKEREKIEKPGTTEQPQTRKSQDLKRPAESFSRSQLGRLNEPGTELGKSSSKNGLTRNVYTPEAFSQNGHFVPQETTYNPITGQQFANETSSTDINAAAGSNGNLDLGNVASWPLDMANMQNTSSSLAAEQLNSQPQASNNLDTQQPQDYSSPTLNSFPSDVMPDSMYSQNAFQQPFVPQDLWQIPMTFEWDWAGMSGISFDTSTMGLPMDGSNAGMGMGGFGMGMVSETPHTFDAGQQRQDPAGPQSSRGNATYRP